MADQDDGPPFDGVDVEFLDGELVVGRQVLPRWVQPSDEWRSGERTYQVYGFTGPNEQDSGRKLFRVFVRPRTDPPDLAIAEPPVGPAPG